MTDTPEERDGTATGPQVITDGGIDAASSSGPGPAIVSGGSEPSSGGRPLRGVPDGQHLFAPAELPRWSLALPALSGLVMAAGVHGSMVSVTGGPSVWVVSAVVAAVALVATAVALRFAGGP